MGRMKLTVEYVLDVSGLTVRCECCGTRETGCGLEEKLFVGVGVKAQKATCCNGFFNARALHPPAITTTFSLVCV